MVAHGIERNDAKTDEIEAAIDALIAPGQLRHRAPRPGRGPDDAARADGPATVRARHAHGRARLDPDLPDAGRAAGRARRGRALHPDPPRLRPRRRARRLGADRRLRGGPHPEFRLCASWKTSVGRVEVLEEHRADPGAASAAVRLPAFPRGALALGIDASDPPQAHAAPGRQLPGDPRGPRRLDVDDTGRDLRVIFLHLDSGRFEIIPLDRTGRRLAGRRPLLLHTFERLFCTDEMAVALVDWPGSAEALDLSAHLVTHWRQIEYPLVAFEQGTLPMSTEELGGWLRNLIATKPTLDLRALYWEHTQANLAPGLSLDRGLTNSAAITAVLNRSVAGKSGMAIRDRSTRQLGSFHQKAVVLVKSDPTTFPDGHTRHRVVAYVGGIDLAHGRWDTDEHHHLDPERQEGGGLARRPDQDRGRRGARRA